MFFKKLGHFSPPKFTYMDTFLRKRERVKNLHLHRLHLLNKPNKTRKISGYMEKEREGGKTLDYTSLYSGAQRVIYFFVFSFFTDTAF